MKKEIVMELKGKEWEELLDHVWEHKKKDVQMDGFRKGQVPKEMYIKKFGIESLYMDAVDHAIPTLYDRLIEENKDLEIACRPSVDVKSIDKDHVEITFSITTKPEVKLGKYKGLGIKKEEAKVTDEEVEHEEGLIRMSVNEEKDLELTFPENYHVEDLKGQKVTFKVKVKEIKERILPEYDEDFFKDLNMPGVNSYETLVNELKNHIKAHKERDIEDKYFDECLTKVSENAKIDVPEEMILDEVDRITDDFSHRLQMQGMNLDTYLKMLNMDLDKFKENFKEEATKRVRFRLCLEQIVKEENIKIDDEELNKYSKDMAEKYQVEEKDLLEQIGGKDFLKYDLEVRKAIEIITE